MKILTTNKIKQVKENALQVLKSGGLLIYPTETCYGVGVDATNSDAVGKLLNYKKRPEGKAISIAVSSEEMATHYVNLNPTAGKIIVDFLPGPLTVICESLHNVDRRLESESGSLGFRIPNYKLLLEIIEEFGKPITSTSANLSGKKTPYKIEDILDNIGEKHKELIDLIIDAGELPHNPPSTVLDTTSDELKIYRQGRINPKEVSSYASQVTYSVEETIQFGEKFMSEILNKRISDKPIVILLNGELGAGKTHLTKGIAKALGVKQIIKSPTYSYVSEYKLVSEPRSSLLIAQSPKLYHFDSWRITTKQDLESLDFYNWFQPENIIVIEWPSVAMNLDEDFFESQNYYYIDFVLLGEERREIKIYEKIVD